MDADGAAATQLLRLAAEAFGETDGLAARRQTGLAAADLDDRIRSLEITAEAVAGL